MLSTPKAKGELFLASSLCDGLEDNDIKQVTTLLLNKEADPNVLIPSHGVAPFHLVIGNDSGAFAEEVTKLFLRHGGDPNVRSVDGLTPVHVAAAWGRVNVLELLLEAGGNPLSLDDEGRSPFHYAFDGKFHNVVSILAKYCGKHNLSTKNRTDSYLNGNGTEESLIKSLDDEQGSIPSVEFFSSLVMKSSPKTEDCKELQHRLSIESNIDIADIKKVNETSEIEVETEKWLVNKIIDQLSTSLTFKHNKQSCNRGSILHSPTSNEEPSMGSEEEEFYMKNRTRKCFDTPKYRHKVLSRRTRSPCVTLKSSSKKNKKTLSRTPLFYNPDDTIISKSPNLLIPTRKKQDCTPQESRYFTPRQRHHDVSFRERNIGRDIVRSTPRRKFYRNSSKKMRKNGYNLSNSLSSPDSSFSHESLQPKHHLRVKLHESKYDQDAEVPSDILPDCTESNNKILHNVNIAHLSSQSLVSVQEEYKYEDSIEGVALLERRHYVFPVCESTKKIACESLKSGDPEMISTLMNLPDQTLRQRLKKLGQEPGPVTNTTRYVYQKRLIKLESTIPLCSQNQEQSPPRKIDQFLEYGNWIDHLNTYRVLERNVFVEFESPTPSKQWREGNSKTSFNYLLLDPRITKDLPYRTMNLSKEEIWKTFISAIFYVGKGKRTRPYSHLYDAFNAWVSKKYDSVNQKIKTILEIWDEGYGVVCLHVFLNTMPVEAFTREAAIIQALGIENLANMKTGEYYGAASRWSLKEKRRFGRYLLYKSLQIFLQEGERQLFPQHL